MGLIVKKSITICIFSLFVLNNLETSTKIKRSKHFPNVLYNKGTDLFAPKKRCLLGWDLNSVIFTKNVLYNFPSMLYNAYKDKGVFYSTWAIQRFFWLRREKKAFKKAGDNRGFLWDAMFTELERQGTTAKEKADNKELVQFLRQFSQQANTLENFMADLLYNLHNTGHRNAVLSNMGQGLLDAQIDAIKNSNRRFTLAINYTLEFLQDHVHKVISSEANGWMHKPNPDIYQIFFTQNSDYHNPDCSIFIDDKKSNCKAALKNGFDIAIVCTKQQNIRPILKALGVRGL